MDTAKRPTILAADDDGVTRAVLGRMIGACGWQPLVVGSGQEALAAFEQPNAPLVGILDWGMPGLTGLDVCQRLRQVKVEVRPYLIMVTAREKTGDAIIALDAGADDYVVKPIEPKTLQARVRVGLRTVGLQETLAAQAATLREALTHVKQLRNLLPICAYCKRIRDDQNYWQTVEHYLNEHAGVVFSHGYCPSCIQEHVEPQLAALAQGRVI